MKELPHLLVSPLSLFVGLWMVSRYETHRDLQFLKKTGPHFGCKLKASITHNVLRDAKVMKYMLEDKFGHFKSRREL